MQLRSICLSSMVFSKLCFGWGEIGHHMIARVAAELAEQHPLLESANKANPKSVGSFLKFLNGSRVELGHLANIPDTYWRNLDNGKKEEGVLLGAPTHFFDSDTVLDIASPLQFFKTKLPLDFETAKALPSKKKDKSFFSDVGSVPWRAQQFADLLLWALRTYPKDCKVADTATVASLGFAGLMTHFTGDASQPLHSTADYDGEGTDEKGIHWYFENDVVNALPEGELEKDVEERGLKLLVGSVKSESSVESLRAKAHDIYGDAANRSEVTAMMIALLGDSYQNISSVLSLDKKYALLKDKSRRNPTEKIGRKKVADYFRTLISYRLAVSAAFTADVWVRQWVKAGSPAMCETRQYAFKPHFISPTDANCLGYALKEKPEDFLKSNKTSALTEWKGALSPETCFKLD